MISGEVLEKIYLKMSGGSWIDNIKKRKYMSTIFELEILKKNFKKIHEFWYEGPWSDC